MDIKRNDHNEDDKSKLFDYIIILNKSLGKI